MPVALSAMLLASTAFGAQPPRTVEASSKLLLSVCDVMADLLHYDGKLIRIRGRVVGTGEGSWLKGFDCPGVMKTDGYVWDSLISLEYPGYRQQLHRVDFEHDFGSDQRIEKTYRRLRRKLPDACLAFTYSGLFETRKEWHKMMDGTPRGFGHLSRAPSALIVKSADDITPIPGCR